MLFSLQRLVSDMSLIERNHRIIGTDQAENDVEHSFAVALICWYVFDEIKADLDLGKIFKYALVHDFVERYAGDVNTFASKEARQKKIESEAASLEKLTDEFDDFPEMVNAMKNYEKKADEEALFVWTVDKMQAIILGDLDGWRPYKEININYETFVDKYTEQLSKSSPYCKEIFAAILEYCKTTYYDRPVSEKATKIIP
jgi:5'-deoxynucleotidase YfbR-like HD superfamily hydrolase